MDELEPIKQKIYELRGQRVMLDHDLAAMYGVETKSLKRAVRRNISRFPSDFMFEVTRNELSRCQFGTIIPAENQNVNNLRYQNSTSSWGGSRYNAFAFTELGVAMLSSVLNSNIAIEINIKIMRAFVSIRQALPIIVTQKDIEDLRQRVKALEESGTATQTALEETRKDLTQVYEALTQLGEQKQDPLPEIGYEAIRKRREEEEKE